MEIFSSPLTVGDGIVERVKCMLITYSKFSHLPYFTSAYVNCTGTRICFPNGK